MNLFQYSKKRDPDNALPINGLGLVAKARGQKEAARVLFQQAVEMVETNNDYRLYEYRKNLVGLELYEMALNFVCFWGTPSLRKGDGDVVSAKTMTHDEPKCDRYFTRVVPHLL